MNGVMISPVACGGVHQLLPCFSGQIGVDSGTYLGQVVVTCPYCPSPFGGYDSQAAGAEGCRDFQSLLECVGGG